MGYTTEFSGEVTVDPPLNASEVSYLKDFATMRHMDRANGPLWISPTVKADYGQTDDPDIYDFNSEHPDLPGLWCKWEPTDDGEAISWNGFEKFYDADKWMKFLVTRLLAPSAAAYVAAHIEEDPRLRYFTTDHEVNGEIEAQGEEADDRWKLIVHENVVSVAYARYNYTEPKEV